MMQERAIELDPDYYAGDYSAVGSFPSGKDSAWPGRSRT
jgi:hypothetical protein